MPSFVEIALEAHEAAPCLTSLAQPSR